MTRQFDRYSLIVGMGGKHCQFDSHNDLGNSAKSLSQYIPQSETQTLAPSSTAVTETRPISFA
ncbi:hypothetical protein F4782DRAFT_517636 [Xylaria castorea]|nr:hypothetical protein F4782DRAFT_517636 [Xylaria castorea]